MKNHRLLWFLGLLLCVSLSACSLQDIQLWFQELFPNLPTPPVQIESVTVLPATGSGHFTATVRYAYNDGDGILCIVDTGQHDDETVLSHGLEGSSATISEPFQFDFARAGEHTLTCKGYSGGSSASDTFTVTSGPDPSDSNSAPTGTQPLKVNGTGTVSGTNSWGNPYSVPSTSLLLTVNSDNSAVLYVVYTMNVDFTQVQYMYFYGTASPSDGTVTFTSCNVDGVPSGEALPYKTLPLSAKYTCVQSPKDGVQQEWKLTMP